MAGGTIPRGFGRLLGRSPGVAATGVLPYVERTLPALSQRWAAQPASGSKDYYYDTKVSPVGDTAVNLFGLDLAGPPRFAVLRVSLNGFLSPWPEDSYPVAVVPNAVGRIHYPTTKAYFSYVIGPVPTLTTVQVGTPSDEGTVVANLWVERL